MSFITTSVLVNTYAAKAKLRRFGFDGREGNYSV
jgi:hypothetical protein